MILLRANVYPSRDCHSALLAANELYEDDVYQANWSRREQISPLMLRQSEVQKSYNRVSGERIDEGNLRERNQTKVVVSSR
jgi:hypothetical protein